MCARCKKGPPAYALCLAGSPLKQFFTFSTSSKDAAHAQNVNALPWVDVLTSNVDLVFAVGRDGTDMSTPFHGLMSLHPTLT